MVLVPQMIRYVPTVETVYSRHKNVQSQRELHVVFGLDESTVNTELRTALSECQEGFVAGVAER